MEIYYLDSAEEINKPIKLFSGNIMLVYTKLTLAEQKYHAYKINFFEWSFNRTRSSFPR